ncbi:MAG: hypothetical protein ABIF82_09290 [Planctomycetota bacterium]
MRQKKRPANAQAFPGYPYPDYTAWGRISKTAAGGIFRGSGVPTFAAAKGSLYVNYDADATTNRLYINTDGSTTWAYFTASA